MLEAPTKKRRRAINGCTAVDDSARNGGDLGADGADGRATWCCGRAVKAVRREIGCP